MKLLISIIVTMYVSVALGQTQLPGNNSHDSSLRFSLTISTFNHAEMIFNGTTTYKITDTSIQVIKNALGGKKGNIIYSIANPISQETLGIINNTGLDTLKNAYINLCVLLTSGNEYVLDITTSSIKKRIRLHHYYLKQLDNIVNLINTKIPEKYQLQYLPKDIEQDCKL